RSPSKAFPRLGLALPSLPALALACALGSVRIRSLARSTERVLTPTSFAAISAAFLSVTWRYGLAGQLALPCGFGQALGQLGPDRRQLLHTQVSAFQIQAGDQLDLVFLSA